MSTPYDLDLISRSFWFLQLLWPQVVLSFCACLVSLYVMVCKKKALCIVFLFATAVCDLDLGWRSHDWKLTHSSLLSWMVAEIVTFDLKYQNLDIRSLFWPLLDDLFKWPEVTLIGHSQAVPLDFFTWERSRYLVLKSHVSTTKWSFRVFFCTLEIWLLAVIDEVTFFDPTNDNGPSGQTRFFLQKCLSLLQIYMKPYWNMFFARASYVLVLEGYVLVLKCFSKLLFVVFLLLFPFFFCFCHTLQVRSSRALFASLTILCRRW